MFGISNKDSMTKIARVLPPALIKAFEKKYFYSVEDVNSIFNREFKTEQYFTRRQTLMNQISSQTIMTYVLLFQKSALLASIGLTLTLS